MASTDSNSSDGFDYLSHKGCSHNECDSVVSHLETLECISSWLQLADRPCIQSLQNLKHFISSSVISILISLSTICSLWTEFLHSFLNIGQQMMKRAVVKMWALLMYPLKLIENTSETWKLNKHALKGFECTKIHRIHLEKWPSIKNIT